MFCFLVPVSPFSCSFLSHCVFLWNLVFVCVCVCFHFFACLFVCDDVLLLISAYLLAFPCSYKTYIKLLTIITVYFKLITSSFQLHTNCVYKVFYIFSSSILCCWSHSLHLLKLHPLTNFCSYSYFLHYCLLTFILELKFIDALTLQY